jgi:O-antigen biosynthesis protein
LKFIRKLRNRFTDTVLTSVLSLVIRFLEKYPFLSEVLRRILNLKSEEIARALRVNPRDLGLDTPTQTASVGESGNYSLASGKSSRRVNWRIAEAELAFESGPVESPRVSLVIPTHNADALLFQLLASFKKFNTYPNYEIIVVTQGSDNRTDEVIHHFSRDINIRAVRNTANESFSVACNRGALTAGFGILLFCNNDVVFVGDILHRVAKLVSDSRVGILGVAQFSEDPVLGEKTFWHVGINFSWDSSSKLLRPRNIGLPPNQDPQGGIFRTWAVNGGFLAISSEDFGLLDGFSSAYDFGYEDVDLALRCWRDLRKLVVVDTDIQIRHEESASRKNVEAALTSVRRIRNSQALQTRVGSYIEGEFLRNRFRTSSNKLDIAPRLSFYVSSLPSENAGHGDTYVAASLAKSLNKRLGWDCVLVPKKNWNDQNLDFDAVVIMRPDTVVPARNWSPYMLRVAWIRNRLDEWVRKPDLHLIDMFFASSIKGSQYFESKARYSCKVMPLAVDLDIFQSSFKRPVRNFDLGITSNFWNSPREVFRARFEEHFKIAVAGRGWDHPNAPKSLAKHWVGQKRYSDLEAFYDDVKVIVDDSTDLAKPWGLGNMRIFEALGSGALVVTNDEVASYELFDGLLPVWSSPDEINELMKTFCANDQERQNLVEELQRILVTRHTYTRRADEFADFINGFLERETIRLMVPCPDKERRNSWGDYFIAKYLGFAMNKLGFNFKISFLEDWDSEEALFARPETRLSLRGLSEYQPRPKDRNLLWVMSHPSNVSMAELSSFDRILAGSEQLRRHFETLGFTTDLFEQFTDIELFEFSGSQGREILPAYVANTRGVRRTISKFAKEQSIDVVVFGEGWTKGDFSQASIIHAPIPNEELPKVYQSHMTVLSDSWTEMNDWGIVSNRVFDAGASGALVVLENFNGDHPVKEFCHLFSNGSELKLTLENLAGLDFVSDRSKFRELIESDYSSAKRALDLKKILNHD